MRKRLLIVEDNDLNRDLLVQLFEDAYELELAADGESALAAVAAGNADLILMDVELPRLSGLDVAEELRAAGADLPIVAVSAGVMEGDRERALEAGCNEFVAKPIDAPALIDLVARLLEGR
jgi:two-component system, cell cycle response regulator DivK